MKLVAFSLENYRRFVGKTSIKLHGPMIAIVGPNEAGKSSLLKAMARINDSSDFDANERPRRKAGSPVLTWHLELQPDDLAAIAHIPEAAGVTRIALERRAESDTRRWTFLPHSIQRNRATRNALSKRLADEGVGWGKHTPVDAGGLDEEHLEAVEEALTADPANFSEEQIGSFKRLAEAFKDLLTDDEAQEAEDKFLTSKERLDAGQLIDLLDKLGAEEAEDSPNARTVEALRVRVPRIELFAEDDRELQSSYDLNEVAEETPAALAHLASLAELDLIKLRDEAVSGHIADVGTRRNEANRRLLDAFDSSWNQQGIAVQIEVQGTELHVQATTPEDSGLSSIDERSDGLRWFAALLAYAHGWEDKPIILVDEIETHLHYDAQSDLVDVLSQQAFTSKVIYTTHSFGCLPQDLGTGVRAVEQLDSATSRIENGFWTKGAGFSPLLVAMGAAAMSLTPTRNAMLAEGASEAILLPSLLRQANDLDSLGFQVAPGLSSVAAMAVGDLDSEAGRVGFLVDGDDGGLAIRAKLMSSSVSEERVIVLKDQASGQALEVEDLVDPAKYVDAVNAELLLWQGTTKGISVPDLSESLVTKSVDTWAEANGLKSPDKAAVAQRLAERSLEEDVTNLERASTLTWLWAECSRTLSRPTP